MTEPPRPVRLVLRGPRDPTRPRLVVFPHAGGSVQAVGELADAVGPAVEVWVVELPGRGRRWREPLLSQWTEAAEAVLDAIDDGRTTVFYGHSFGGRLAFEVLLRAERSGREVARSLVVSGCRSPDHPQEGPRMSARDDAGLVAALAELGGLDGLTANPGLLRMFLPAIRAEVTLAESWSRAAGSAAVTVPITAFASSRDALADHRAVRGWRSFTTAGCDLPVVACSHFLDASARAVVAERLRRDATEVADVHA